MITFGIEAGTYDFKINFCITKDFKRACKFINYKLEEDKFIEDYQLNGRGKRIYKDGYCPVIWLPKLPKSPRELGTAQHEIFHTVCDVMRWAGIPLTHDTEEAYCHLIGHLTTLFFENVNKRNKRKS